MMKNYRNFLIVGTQRTGSSALADAIANSDEIACGWEWTQRVAPWKQIQLANLGLDGNFTSLKKHHQQHMQQAVTKRCQWLGFRRLFRASDKWLIHPRFAPALMLDRLEAHIDWLSKCRDINIIHIVRNDNIEWLKSKYVSRATGSYIGKKYPQELQVVIPIDKAISRLQSKEWIDRRLANLNQTNRYIRICYEDFLAQPRQVTVATFKFLDVETSTQRGENLISRQSQGLASDYIANYAKLEAALHEKGLLASSLPA